MTKMNNILSKKLNKKGFTLAELLVVVAIIAILVAVSIPIFSGKLNEAKKATDDANMRAAKAAAVTEYLSDAKTGAETYYYDAANGVISEDTAVKGYNQADSGDIEAGTGIVQVTIDGETVTATWVASTATA